MRLDVADNPAFEAVARRAEKVVSAARVHAAISFEQLLEAAGGADSAADNDSAAPRPHPLFQAAFLLGTSGRIHDSLRGHLYALCLPHSNVAACVSL